MSKAKHASFSAGFYVTVWCEVPLSARTFDDAVTEAKALAEKNAEHVLNASDSYNDWSVRLGSVSNLTESGGL